MIRHLYKLFFYLSEEMTETKPEFKLKNPPEDGISRVTFGPHSSQFLLVSSWDKKV